MYSRRLQVQEHCVSLLLCQVKLYIPGRTSNQSQPIQHFFNILGPNPPISCKICHIGRSWQLLRKATFMSKNKCKQISEPKEWSIVYSSQKLYTVWDKFTFPTRKQSQGLRVPRIILWTDCLALNHIQTCSFCQFLIFGHKLGTGRRPKW